MANTDPRLALRNFVAALERHFEAAATGRGSDDPAVVSAYEHLKSAFLDYEEALSEEYGEYLPMELVEDEDDWA